MLVAFVETTVLGLESYDASVSVGLASCCCVVAAGTSAVIGCNELSGFGCTLPPASTMLGQPDVDVDVFKRSLSALIASSLQHTVDTDQSFLQT